MLVSWEEMQNLADGVYSLAELEELFRRRQAEEASERADELALVTPAHHVCRRSREDQLGAESAMGETQGIETQAHDLSRSPKENRRRSTCAMGKGEAREQGR